MGWTARHLLLVTTTVLMGTVAGVDPFNLPPLDCARINVAFCCTSRIRALCPTECQGVPCGPSFYHTLFSTDGDTNGLVVGAGQQPAPEWSFQNGKFREEQNGGNPLAIPGTVSNNKEGDATILTPSEAKPFESATTILPALGTTKSPYFSGVVTGFPTLIPDLAQSTLGGSASTPYYPTPSSTPAPSSQVMYVKELGGEKPDLAEFGILPGPAAAVAAGVSTVQPTRQLATTTAAVPQRTTGKPRRRTTPDPRIIKPPSELVIISEYDEDAPPESQPASVIPSMGGASATAPPLPTSTVATASAAPTATTEQKWHANVLPHGTDSVGLGPRKEGPEKRIKIFAVDGSTIGRSRGSNRRVQHSVDEASQFAEKPQIAEKPSTMHNRTNSFFLPLSFNFRPKTIGKTDQISSSVAGNGPNVDTAAVIPPQFIPQTIRPLFQTAAPTTLPPTTTTRRSHLIPISPIITQPSPPTPTGQCGVAPDFVPCLSAAQASKSLLRCCQAKGLPPGCQDLCRYDITQAEVKAAMDAGRCGLLSVQPYLECASQGRDNTECCQYRGIGQKSGPQCIDLCRPHPLHPLGLQHIVCGSVIKDLLQCHHSGVRE